MKSNFTLYKLVVKEHLAGLESKENATLYHNRIVYIKCVPSFIGKNENRQAYAYLCKDMTTQHEQQKRTIERACDENLSGADVFDELQQQGVFVLISTRQVAKEKLLSLYFMRDQIEKIFELCK